MWAFAGGSRDHKSVCWNRLPARTGAADVKAAEGAQVILQGAVSVHPRKAPQPCFGFLNHKSGLSGKMGNFAAEQRSHFQILYITRRMGRLMASSISIGNQ